MLCHSLLYSKVNQLYTCIHAFLYSLPLCLLQDVEYSCLCYTVGPCYLPVLYVIVCCAFRACSVMSDSFVTPWIVARQALLCPWVFPGKNPGVGCHFFLQGIFLTQGSNLCLLDWQVDPLPPSHQGSPYVIVCIC